MTEVPAVVFFHVGLGPFLPQPCHRIPEQRPRELIMSLSSMNAGGTKQVGRITSRAFTDVSLGVGSNSSSLVGG
jgi:hypothetical protein